MSDGEPTKADDEAAPKAGQIDNFDPNDTAGEEPESGGGYGNHAAEPPAAGKSD